MIRIILKRLFERGLKVGDCYEVEFKNNTYFVNGEASTNNSNLKTLLKNFKSKHIVFTIESESSVLISDITNNKKYSI